MEKQKCNIANVPDSKIEISRHDDGNILSYLYVHNRSLYKDRSTKTLTKFANGDHVQVHITKYHLQKDK